MTPSLDKTIEHFGRHGLDLVNRNAGVPKVEFTKITVAERIASSQLGVAMSVGNTTRQIEKRLDAVQWLLGAIAIELLIVSVRALLGH